MKRSLSFVLQDHALCIMFPTTPYISYFWHIGQEQNLASQIVHVVIAGNSVELPRGLLNGQVTHFDATDNKVQCTCLVIAYKFRSEDQCE